MDLQKTIRLVRGAFIFLVPLVGVLLYVNPIPGRGANQPPAMVGTFFWPLMIMSLAEVAVMQVIARNMISNLSPSDPAARAKAMSTGAIVLGLVGLSPLVYAVFYYMIGAPIPRALAIAGMAILGHFMFIALIPKLTDAVAIKRP